MIHQDVILLIYAIGQIAGTSWVAWRMSKVESVLGNGRPSKFITRLEMDLLREVMDKEHEIIKQRIGNVERKNGL